MLSRTAVPTFGTFNLQASIYGGMKVQEVSSPSHKIEVQDNRKQGVHTSKASLIAFGRSVNQEQLTAKGYGESRPIAPNTHPDGSDNQEGRMLNRRTEFKIIGELK